ncbi:Glutamate carboxypeptidase [Globisporangium polare]
MAPLSSSKPRGSPVLTGDTTTAADAYGTFAPHHESTATGAPTTRGRVLLRTAGVAAGVMVLLAAAGFVGTSDRHSSTTVAPGQATNSAVVVSEHSTASLSQESILSELESNFINGIDKTQLREHLHFYASAPHSAGTKRDYETAVYTAKQFESFGLNASIKEYHTLLSRPVRRHLAIVAPQEAAQVLNLDETIVEGDSCTSSPDALPPFLAYAATGNVTASVVYANLGGPQDFQYLLDQNVTLKGKIALVRYGGTFRSMKVYAAEQQGMAGVLIYSDPHEDGYSIGKTYPDGPWRPVGSYQRGSLDYLSIAGGDPLTPGFASKLGAPYLKYEDVNTVPRVPVLPLSYGQAQLILKSLKGKKAPETWQGALPMDGVYHVGDDEATVLNLDLEMDNSIGPIWDVIGTIDGAVEPEQQVLVGNHRDAWVCGAVDPNSGSTALLEIARGFGNLLKTGWRPRRSLVLGSWDGEEYALLGSTEFAEDNAHALTKNAVAYINVDSFLGPVISAAGAPSIAKLLIEVAKAVPANSFYGNETETSLYEQWENQAAVRRNKSGNAVANAGTLAPDYLVSFMGSGSDFTPFYQHLGVISANLLFGLEGGHYGVYHSTMDSVPYFEKFADPDFVTETTIARWWGLLALRLADSEVIPFDFSTYGRVMDESLRGFETKLEAKGFNVSTAELRDAIHSFDANAVAFHASIAEFENPSTAGTDEDANTKTDELREKLNRKLINLERKLLTEGGLPHRPWYKHVIFGPGFYEGYSGTAFPGIDDCIAFKDNATTIQAHVDDVARVVTNAANFLISA